jgi:flagellar protein FliJ
MSHPSLRPLLLLLEHAESERDQVLARQRRADVAVVQAERQQEQLQAYRQESETRWTSQMRAGGMTVTMLQCYQGFAERLHGAVALQGQQIERLRGEQQRAQADTLAAELRVASVRKLLERRGQTLQQAADRREQKQMDEMAARAGRVQRAGFDQPGVG